ncbi:MAG: bifunctional folylpolyglutamate synthase/dihydrofolate synthase [Deltaproteobacteria bacterium]|nr:bifunctional folylpolyglutamate synthase/dihydrofolate synthase [Deltaproteobacteria bacterium]MBW2360264.1 bifunctional folylpolyglutamate synthase/dihydrofolate synthase [Deltaproteobacteria bacterium]
MQSVAEAGAWLESLVNLEQRSDWPYSRVGLGPICALLARLDDPQWAQPCIHVAGSKGKGSTVLLAEAVLSASGQRVGAFTSPHLERWTERIRLGGREVDAAALVAAVAEVRPHVEALRAEQPENAPTFFDVTTAVAFVCFRAAGVDRAVLEVGLGGRLDSTNVVTPEVTCITSIELEHTDKLGGTLGAIAGEKAGILKPGVPAVVGALPAEAAEVVRARAEEIGVSLGWIGQDFGFERLGEAARDRRVRLWDADFSCEVELGVRGRHQLGNAALALACVRRVGVHSGTALAKAAREGLAAARLPGRCEIVGTAPLLMVDSAHTAASARCLAVELDEWSPDELHLVLSVSADKALAPLLDALLPRASSVTLTRAEPHRSCDPESLARSVRARAPQLALQVVPDAPRALREVLAQLAPDAAACATGSVYLAGIARRVWRAAAGGADAAD